jgi:tRNA A-37 threonylcarbamoyl transferase component Bud32
VGGDLEGLGPRFRLDVFVARGAWGSVYRGLDLESGTAVAVKRLHPHLSEPTMIARFEREAALVAALDSPHVVRHVAHGRDDEGRPYLALEWLDGEDLARWKRSRRLATRRMVVEVVRQAALGLAVLHEACIVHRDVKPSNFFLVEGAGGVRVKLIDLGISRASGEANITATGFTMGTPAYMSPEQARGERSPTAASDLFSLGVMLFELFSGKKPYRGDDMVSLATKIVLQDPPRLRDVLPDAPPALDELLARAMGKAPEDRFPSALGFSEALGELEVGDEPVDPPDSERESKQRIVLSDSGPASGSPALWALAPAAERVITALFVRFDGVAEPAPAIEGFREAAERHGGVFHPVLGPQRAAVFGAARGRGDEPLRAARAALAVASIPGVRLAIVTGRAVAGEGLSGGLVERGLAEVRRSHGEVRVDETTARLLEGHFTVDGLKGERVLRAAEPPPDVLGPRLLGRPAPLLGRDREAAGLYALFEECVSEPVARAVLVSGPPGAGKSRLVYELLRRAGGSLVLRCRGEAPGLGEPFATLAPALRRAEIAPPPAGAPEGAIASARAAWEVWIAAECAARPVILVLDDLHWGDLPSVAFVDGALARASASPFLVVAAARPEVHERFPGLFVRRALEEVRLGPLTRKASEKLVRLALGPEVDDGVVRRVVDRAEGNAFYLEELVQAVADGSPGDDLSETVLARPRRWEE